MEKCAYCGKESILDIRRHQVNCKEWRKARKSLLEKIVTKEFIREHLEQKRFSSNYIVNEILNKNPLFRDFKIDVGGFIERATSFGIKTPNFKESANLSSVRNKHKSTCLAKYGVENPSQSGEIKEIKENKALSRYGVRNVFQSPEIIKKSQKTCLEKYGSTNFNTSIHRKHHSGKRSKLQKIVEKTLDELGIHYQVEVANKFSRYNEKKHKEYRPIVDILVEEFKLVIEIQGDRFHANPELYNPRDIIVTWDGDLTAEKIWERDRIRKEHIESFGYRVKFLWGMDILEKGSKKIICSDLKEKVLQLLYENSEN